MARKTQEEIVLNYIKRHGTINTVEAFDMGITRLSGRIFQLRAQGYDVDTKYIKGKKYADYFITGTTVTCPECGRQTKATPKSKKVYRDHWGEPICWSIWRECTHCESEWEDEEELTEEEVEMYTEGDSLEEINNEVWRDYVNTEVAALQRM